MNHLKIVYVVYITSIYCIQCSNLVKIEVKLEDSV
jgi:hypothetical protein